MDKVTQQRGFIRHLHAFRGFAIVNIVAVHAFASAITFVRPEDPPRFDAFLSLANEIAFHDSTIYFALISGLLYSTVLAGRGWGKFYSGKLRNVLLPYVFFTLLLTLWVRPPVVGAEFGGLFASGAGEYFKTVGLNLVDGGAMFHLWYMPVLAVLFLATPLIAGSLGHKQARWLVLLVVLAPLAVSRSGIDVSVQSVVYFLGVYAVGIAVGRDYDRWLAWLERNLLLLGAVAILASLLFPLLGRLGFQQVGFWNPVESLHYIHKLAIAGVALVLLKRWEERIPRWLDLLATYAFAIYFLHAVVIVLLEFAANSYFTEHPSLVETLAMCALWLTLAIGVSVAITWVVRRIFGKRSRMIVGA